MINVKKEYRNMFEKYGDSLYQTIFFYCKNVADSEDITQNAFLKLYLCEKEFESEEHVKNWLYKVAINEANNVKKSKWFHYEQLPELQETQSSEQTELYEKILKLPDKYRIVIFLYYYDGYDTNEIATMLNKSVSTIQTHLQRARKKLKKYIETENQTEAKMKNE